MAAACIHVACYLLEAGVDCCLSDDGSSSLLLLQAASWVTLPPSAPCAVTSPRPLDVRVWLELYVAFH